MVFFIAAGLVALFALWGVVFTDSLANAADATLTWLLERFGWLFVLSVAASMNRAVDIDKTDVSTVTARFLRQNGLLRTD